MGTIIERHLVEMDKVFDTNGEKYCEHGAAADLLQLCYTRSCRFSNKRTAPELQDLECLVSIERLAERWRWGSEKTRRFLKYLEELHLVELKYSPGKGTYIRLLDPDQAE